MDPKAASAPGNPKVFLDVSVGEMPAKRLVFEVRLFFVWDSGLRSQNNDLDIESEVKL